MTGDSRSGWLAKTSSERSRSVPIESLKRVQEENLEGDYIFHARDVVTAVDRHRSSASYASGIQILNPRWINLATRGATDSTTLASAHRSAAALRVLRLSQAVDLDRHRRAARGG